MSWFNIWRGWVKLEISKLMAYRFNFVLKSIAMLIFGIGGPLIAMIIYNISSGIPGWTFEEFLLINGIFIFIAGLNHLLFESMTWRIIHKVRDGSFDVRLVKPISALIYATITGVELEGLSRTFLGGIIIVYSLVKMGWAFSLINLVSFIFLIFLAMIFMYSIDVITTALSFLVVKSYALMDIFREFTHVGRYPITIYGTTGMMAFTFLFPVGLAAFYPASAILGKIPTITIFYLAAVAFAFFGFSILLWKLAIRKYSSAGG